MLFQTILRQYIWMMFLCVLGVTPAFSQTVSYQMAIDQAGIKKLWTSPTWIKLLHYRSHPLSGFIKSDIQSSSYFLSPNGTYSPQEELEATIQAFFDQPPENHNVHAQCKFPARYLWLNEQLNLDQYQPPKLQCPGFQEWSLNGKVDSISVVFATGYLKNPASYYGHILITLDSNDHLKRSDLMDESINYGAVIPKNENMLIYMVKGVAGFYPASYSHEKFYRIHHNYTENQLRDMWSYRLNLTKRDVQFLVAHIWEVIGQKYEYYFFTDNCAYRMADLLDLVTETPVLSPYIIWSIPLSVFNGLNASAYKGASLVKSTRLIPSRQNRFTSKYALLNVKEQDMVQRVVGSIDVLKSNVFQTLPNVEKARVLQTLLDYYQFLLVGDSDNAIYRSIKQTLLLEQFKLPMNLIQWPQITDTPPHFSQKSSKLSMSYVSHSIQGNGFEFGIRGAYFDFLSLNIARVPNSQLKMMDLKFIYLNQKLRFRQVDLVNIETLNISRTGLPGDGGMAWRVNLGIETEDLSKSDFHMAILEGGIGKGVTFLSQFSLYGMIDARLHPQSQYGAVSVKPHMGLLYAPLSWWKTHITLGYRYYLGYLNPSTPTIFWENRFGLSRVYDLRLSYDSDFSGEIKASLNYHF